MARRRLALGILLSALFLIVVFSPVRELFSQAGFERLRAAVASLGALAPLGYVALYTGATVFCLPGSLLTLLGGSLFGPHEGFLWVWLGSNLGANAAFAVGRYLGSEAVKRLTRRRLPGLEKEVGKNGFHWVLGLRLIPIVPFFLLNYACGLSPVKWRDYLIATAIGMAPATYVFTSVGSYATGGKTDWSQPQYWVPFVIGVGVLLLPLFRRKSG